MDIKKLFINLIIVLFIGVMVFSVVTVIKRSNEPKDDYVIPDNTQSVIFDNISDDTESEVVTETTESTETSETDEEPDVEETRTLYVQGSVNVRSGPGTNYPLAGSLALNAEVTAVGPEVDGWQKIIYRDTEAYVSAEYLAETPVETAPNAQPEGQQPPASTPDPGQTNPTPPADPGQTDPAPPADPAPTPEEPAPTPEEPAPTPEPTPDPAPTDPVPPETPTEPAV